MAAAQCAGCRRAQSPGPKRYFLALHRRAPAGDRRAADDPAGKGSALRAVRGVAERSNPLAHCAQHDYFLTSMGGVQINARFEGAHYFPVKRAVRRLTVITAIVSAG